MENEIYLTKLYDYYGSILTDKQREYFEDYYFNNLSLLEISENYNISRNAVHKQLKEAVLKLEDLESKLNIYEKMKKIENILENNPDILDKIKQIMNK